MSEIEEPGSGEPTGDMALIGEEPKSHLVSMQVLQDVYNELTGKTEELTKGYEIPYQVSFEDLEQLNHKITQLYEQYNVVSANCAVTVYHEKDQKQVYSSLERFRVYDRSSMSPTESVLIKYSILIILPKLKKPQGYTISVRVGSKVTMLKNMDDDDLPGMIIKIVSGRNAQVTIEYIDYTVARNFIDTIDGWFNSVESSKFSKYVLFAKKHSHYFPALLKYGIGIFSAYLCIKYAPVFID